MKAIVAVLAAILGIGALLTACEDADEIEITGPVLEEVLASTQATPGLRISGTPAHYLEGQPLFFINGVRMSEDQSEWDELDPKDIEKITVIKGTKAVSLYGTDAEHGVILITLKDSISG